MQPSPTVSYGTPILQYSHPDRSCNRTLQSDSATSEVSCSVPRGISRTFSLRPERTKIRNLASLGNHYEGQSIVSFHFIASASFYEKLNIRTKWNLCVRDFFGTKCEYEISQAVLSREPKEAEKTPRKRQFLTNPLSCERHITGGEIEEKLASLRPLSWIHFIHHSSPSNPN